MSITKNVLLNWYSSMKKKIEKDSDDFWHKKLTLKVKFWHFFTPPHYTNSQISIISFGYSWLLGKNPSKFVLLVQKLDNLNLPLNKSRKMQFLWSWLHCETFLSGSVNLVRHSGSHPQMIRGWLSVIRKMNQFHLGPIGSGP